MIRAELRIAIVIILLMAFGLCGNVIAAPSITSASGTVTHGQSITLVGSGFGSKAIAVQNLFDTVNGIYTSINNGDAIPVGGVNPWNFNNGPNSSHGQVKYDNVSGDQRHSHSTACYKSSNAYLGVMDGRVLPGASKLYISWWFKTATSIPLSNHSSKYLRLSDSDDEINQTFSWTQLESYVYDSHSSCNYNGSHPYYCNAEWVNYVPPVNQWVFFEVFMDSINHHYTIKANNTIIANNINWSPGAAVFNEVWKVGFDGGGVSPPNITFWMDDIYIDNTPQRVVIGNNSTYSSCTHLEVQPPTAWSSDGQSITVTVNQGTFTDGQTVYLYVVDASNNVNAAGYSITFGKGQDADTIIPAKPTGVVAQPIP